MDGFCTPAQYADARELSRARVSQLMKDGKIPFATDAKGRKWIDPEAADLARARNTDPDQQQRSSPAQAAITQQQAAAVPRGGHERHPQRGGDGGDPFLVEAKTRTELLKAELLEIELAEKRGELINADDARRVSLNLARSTRNAFMALPARLAPILAPIADAAEVERLLEAEIRKVCQQLATTPTTEQ